MKETWNSFVHIKSQLCKDSKTLVIDGNRVSLSPSDSELNMGMYWACPMPQMTSWLIGKSSRFFEPDFETLFTCLLERSEENPVVKAQKLFKLRLKVTSITLCLLPIFISLLPVCCDKNKKRYLVLDSHYLPYVLCMSNSHVKCHILHSNDNCYLFNSLRFKTIEKLSCYISLC